jgi:hypothetical protein
LKRDNLNKFESHSPDDILVGYTHHDRSYRMLYTIVKSYDVTFDETAPCPHDVFECVGDNEMEDSIFVNEELHGFNGVEDESLLLHHHSSLFLLIHLKQRLLRLLPLP